MRQCNCKCGETNILTLLNSKPLRNNLKCNISRKDKLCKFNARVSVIHLGILEENISRCHLGAFPLVLVLAR